MSYALKDLYSIDFINNLSNDFKMEYSNFDRNIFTQQIFNEEWEEKALLERMRHICYTLHDILDLTFSETIRLFKKVIVKRENLGLEYLFFNHYVSCYGIKDWNASMDALSFFTIYSSAEFAIRPFILKYEQKTMEQLLQWSEDTNEHTRRLASEGCRPRLPWGMGLPRLKKDPTLILPILENLKNDSSEYVRRSVANNLNDISKDHPEIVLDIAERWHGKHEKTDRILKHALRTLLKKGDTRALILFGFENPKNIEIIDLNLNPQIIKIGSSLEFEFLLQNTYRKSKLRLEYRIHFITKTNGISKKIFQLKEQYFPKGDFKIYKKQSFKNLTTRKHYKGSHQLDIVVNGITKASTSFELIP